MICLTIRGEANTTKAKPATKGGLYLVTKHRNSEVSATLNLPKIRRRVKRKQPFPLMRAFAPDFRPFRAGYPQPERRNYVYSQSLAEALKTPPRKDLRRGARRPLDRNAKSRIMAYADGYTRRTGEGPALGAVDPRLSGRAGSLALGHPQQPERPLLPKPYETIAEGAKCARTVYEAIKALEAADVLTWVNRITDARTVRGFIRQPGAGLEDHPHQQCLYFPRPLALRFQGVSL